MRRSPVAAILLFLLLCPLAAHAQNQDASRPMTMSSRSSGRTA